MRAHNADRPMLSGTFPLRAAAWALVLLAACSSPPPASAPPSGEVAVIEANRRAGAYLRSGNLESAARYYREAIRLAQSVEDAEGIAANAINLSIVYQRLGKLNEARASLAPLFEQNRVSFSADRLAQAALRHAVLDLEERHLASSNEWVERAAPRSPRRALARPRPIRSR